MECTGNITQISQDFETKGILVTLSLTDVSVQELQALKVLGKLSVTMKKFCEKRSLNANSYFHVLVKKIAKKLNISDTRCKNIMIGRYGQIDFLPDGEMVVIKTNIQPSDMLEQETLHTVPCGVDIQNGKEILFYRVYRGSHTYDTKEMSCLIDGTVQEAKDLGIETLSPQKIERMMQEYGKKHTTG